MDDGRYAGSGFVQHQELGLGHEGPAHGHLLPLPAGELAGRLGALFRQYRKELEHLVHGAAEIVPCG